MEWLIGLLIGIAWGAGFSSFVHWAHEQEKIEKATKAERVANCQDKRIIEPKVKEPWVAPTKEQQRKFSENTRASLAAHLERGNTVDSLDDVPTNCSCDWAGEQTFAEAEPRIWHRTMKDPKCDVHSTNDAWLERQ